ncbi:MAG: cytidylate kinase-like family protein [Treponema sp.]|nr:cytidylate kinase-like family protein [Treponema sp.]
MAVIAISRQVAALGDEVASEVAQKIGYKFINRQEIERRIVELGFPAEKLKKYDEKKPGFFASLVKDRDEYLHYLQTAVLEAAKEGDCILIGRGAFVILESLPNLISMRFVCNDDLRVRRLMQEFNWNEKQALQRINESDTNRHGFHKSFFNVDLDEASHFMMVLNTGIFDEKSAADAISTIVKDYITPEKEEEGKKRLTGLLQCQHLVNKLVFEYKLNIEFLRAVMNGDTVTLQGVADSTVLVERAMKIAAAELPEFKITSAISVVQDFKAHI